jgi:hypothetical protein
MPMPPIRKRPFGDLPSRHPEERFAGARLEGYPTRLPNHLEYPSGRRFVAPQDEGWSFQTASKSLPTLIVASIASVWSVAPAGAQQRPIEAPTGETACAIGAFVTETDPAGLNVRSGPGTSFGIVGRLPPVTLSKEIDGLSVMVEVEITASAKGWFRIRNARDNAQLTGAAERAMYGGRGWVSGQKLTAKTQSPAGRAQPNETAAIVLGTEAGLTLDNDGLRAAGRLIGCQGKWALLEFGPLPAGDALGQRLDIAPAAQSGLPQGRFRAWLNQICAIQETSCSGF